MSKTYKTEITAKMIAGKKAKATGVKHFPVLVENGEWEVLSQTQYDERMAKTQTTVKIPHACWKEISQIIAQQGIQSVELELVGKHINLMLNGNKVWFFLDSRIADNTLLALKAMMG